MEHIKSSFYFEDKNGVWQVDYTYNNTSHFPKSTVYFNNEIYWDFDSIPSTRTEHPTKSQAKEILSAARKKYKEAYALRDKREKYLQKLLK
jgi:hypothetical protein